MTKNANFWKKLNRGTSLPSDPKDLENQLRSISPSMQAEFLWYCAERTSWRQLPQLKKAAANLWPAATVPKSHGEVERAIHLAHLYYYWGKNQKARRYLKSAQSYPKLSRKEEGLIAWIKAKNASGLQNMTEAYRSFRQAERLLDERYPLERGRVCGAFGLFYRQIGESEKAHFWIRKGLDYLRRTRDAHSQAILYGNLGQLCRELGRYSEALFCFEKDIQIGIRANDVYGQLLSRIRIAEIYRLLNNDELAVKSYRAAIEIGAKHPEHRVVVFAQLGLAQILIRKKKFREARKRLSGALQRIDREPRLRYRSAYKITLARLIQNEKNDLTAAHRVLLEAKELARRSNDVFMKVKVLHDLFVLEILRGQKTLARRHILEALHLSETAGLHESIVLSERFLAENFMVDFTTVRLGRYIGHAKASAILSTRAVQAIGSKRVDRTILSGDLRGFTKMSERFSPNRVTRILNRYFDSVSGAIDRTKGNLDKFMGDGFIAVFPGTVSGARLAAQAARIIQRETQDLNLMLKNDLDGYRLTLGQGIEQGPVVEGEIGSSRRFDYTVIGDTVNTAFRLQQMAGADEILLGPGVNEILKRSETNRGFAIFPGARARLKGKSRLLQTYRLETLANRN